MAQFSSNLEKTHTGRKRPTMAIRLGFSIENFFANLSSQVFYWDSTAAWKGHDTFFLTRDFFFQLATSFFNSRLFFFKARLLFLSNRDFFFNSRLFCSFFCNSHFVFFFWDGLFLSVSCC